MSRYDYRWSIIVGPIFVLAIVLIVVIFTLFGGNPT